MKVMLVDDHSLFMEGLQYLLKTHSINVVGSIKNAREVLSAVRTLKPDIILMDIIMPEYSGLDLLKLIKTELPEIKVVMLTTSDDDEDLFTAIKYGASGYLLKNTGADELVGLLYDLEKGEIPLSPGLAVRILKEFRRGCTQQNNMPATLIEDLQSTQLTKRQLEVLELVASGMFYKEVGAALGLTERTIKYHMGRIIDILHLEKKSQAIVYAGQVGLLPDK